LIDGAFRFSCDVGDPPGHILITDGWGFIVVKSGNWMVLFDVNGTLIRRMKCEFRIQCIVTWKGQDGCDWLAVADGNQIRIIEAFYLKLNKYVFSMKGKVVTMHYLVGQHALAVITSDGDVLLIPFGNIEAEGSL
jgi:hypothetical protein